MKDLKKETTVIISLIVLAVASRLLPHPPNFAPITGIALFAAAKFQNRLIALALPLVCLFMTDLILGLGWISKKVKIQTVLLSSVVFFVVSNLGVWLLYYPLTIEGLTSCFTLAIPFFTNTLLGDLAYSAVLFYSFSTLKNTYLRPA
jgi:hypothetical protein